MVSIPASDAVSASTSPFLRRLWHRVANNANFACQNGEQSILFYSIYIVKGMVKIRPWTQIYYLYGAAWLCES